MFVMFLIVLFYTIHLIGDRFYMFVMSYTCYNVSTFTNSTNRPSVDNVISTSPSLLACLLGWLSTNEIIYSLKSFI